MLSGHASDDAGEDERGRWEVQHTRNNELWCVALAIPLYRKLMPRGASDFLSRKSSDMSASHPSLSAAFYHMSDYVFFEYTGVVHLIRNPKESGAPIHCLAKMKAKDSRGNAQI